MVALLTTILRLSVVVGEARFGGASTCPAPEEVARAFAPLRDQTVAVEEDVAIDVTVTTHDRWASVAIADVAGQIIPPRALPAKMSCAERARTAAVIVATYLDARAAREMTKVASASPGVVAATQVPPASVAPPQPEGTRDEIDFGLVGVRGEQPLIPGFGFGFTHAFAFRHRVRAGFAYAGRDRLAIAGGAATWTRRALTVGYRGRAWAGPGGGFLDVGADVVASRLSLTSEGFRRTEAAVVFHPGLSAVVRGGGRLSKQVVWGAGAGATYWAREQRVFLRDVEASATLSRFEVFATIGLSWSLR